MKIQCKLIILVYYIIHRPFEEEILRRTSDNYYKSITKGISELHKKHDKNKLKEENSDLPILDSKSQAIEKEE